MDVEMGGSVSLPELGSHITELVPLIAEVGQSITEFVRVAFRVFDEVAPYILRRVVFELEKPLDDGMLAEMVEDETDKMVRAAQADSQQ
jgi:hypothetical protein